MRFNNTLRIIGERMHVPSETNTIAEKSSSVTAQPPSLYPFCMTTIAISARGTMLMLIKAVLIQLEIFRQRTPFPINFPITAIISKIIPSPNAEVNPFILTLSPIPMKKNGTNKSYKTPKEEFSFTALRNGDDFGLLYQFERCVPIHVRQHDLFLPSMLPWVERSFV